MGDGYSELNEGASGDMSPGATQLPVQEIRILVVEDNRGDFILLRELLARATDVRYELEWVQTVPDAAEAMRRKEHDAAIVDFRLVGGSGLDVLREAVTLDWPAPVIMMTGQDDPGFDQRAMKLGAYDFFDKGDYHPKQVDRSIRYAIERRRMESVAKATNGDLIRYIAALRDAKEEIERQRHRIVSLAYHLASAGHGDEAPSLDGIYRRPQVTPHSHREELGTWHFDPSGRAIEANHVALSFFEIDDPVTLLQTPIEHLVEEKGLEALRQAMRSLVPGQESTLELELIGQHTGRRSWAVMSVLAVGESDEVQSYATTIVDITSRRNVERSTHYLARHDSLTGLFNRASFEEHMQQATAIARRNGSLVAVLCLDLDGFKEVNDTWGHKAGDHLLKVFAGRLEAATRKSDTVARLGGDEFVVLATNIKHGDHAALLARAIVDRLEDPVDFRGQELRCGASVGISLFPDDTTNADDLVEFADVALYRAKSAEVVRWCYFDGRVVDYSPRIDISQPPNTPSG